MTHMDETLVIVRGAGDIATGTIVHLARCGRRVLALESQRPTAIRRTVALNGGRAEVFLALDESTVECAVNGQWLSGRVYPEEGCNRVWVECAGPAEGCIGYIRDEK